ncbi:MAG TPA: helix-turn-helix domain-containing protein [Rhizomicrobium sp.]|jgi:AcrR family transcriptional regulator
MPEGKSTRERILAAAERLFAESGYSNVSMPAIAKASGITAGAIYKHFEGKDDLFLHVVRHAAQSSATAIGPDDGSAVTRLPRGAALCTMPGLKLLRQIAIEMHYAARRDAKVRRLLRRSLDMQIDGIAADIAAAQKTGELDHTLDPRLLASSVMVFIVGLMDQEVVVPSLIGDAAWHDFVEGRVAALLGLPPAVARNAALSR